tara:strand:+ start:635 stop:1072 length:438 start_codon:yes stop_codon:yes gene_type:complete
MLFIISITMMALLYILSYIRAYNRSEYFSQQCAKLIKPTCKKKNIFASISKLEEDINELTYLVRNKSKNKDKYAKMYKWYQNKLLVNNQLKDQATKNAQDVANQFIKETSSKIEKDMRVIKRNSRNKLNKDAAHLHRKYKPLHLT